MDADRWGRVRTLFAQLVDVPEAEHGDWLARHCDDDEQVRERLERLVAADRTAPRWLTPESLERLLDEPAFGLAPGAIVGTYRLRELIATGGMGAVWLAEQTQPRRLVALKTLRSDLPGHEALKRFRAEAELLGRLRHPGIAQVFDAGTCIVDGREVPYLAMEYVEKSHNLLEAARTLDMDRRARLRLFAEVCDAVHHGHQRGVIHRDLKPGNVLVDAEGRPKVIDFGLARALDPERFGVSLAKTRAGEVFGTLAYMSPEQMAGRTLDVDVRSDVYALGCILCELLTGAPPLAIDDLPLAELGRRIAEEPPRLPRALPADLRWILVKTLEKDPGRRYPSASELAADVRRVIASQPVLAGPPSSLYEMTRFARRHRFALLAGLAVIAALLVGLLQARSEARAARLARADALAAGRLAEEARALAERQADLARTASFFLSDLFHSSGVYERGKEARVVDAIAEAESRLPSIEDPTARAILTGIVGEAHLHLDDRARGAPLIATAVETLRASLAPEDLFRLNAEVVLADLLEQEERVAESRALSEELLPRLETHHGPAHPRTLYLRFNLAVCCVRLGDFAEALRLFHKNLALVEQSLDSEDSIAHRRDLLTWIGDTCVDMGRFEEGIEALGEALELARASTMDAGSNESHVRMAIGRAWLLSNEPELALPELLEAERLFESNPSSAGNRFAIAFNLASCLRKLGRFEEAQLQSAVSSEILARNWTTAGPRHLALALERSLLAIQRGELEQAEAFAREALDLSLGLHSGGSARVTQARAVLAEVLLSSGRPREAEALAREACEALRARPTGAPSQLASLLEVHSRALLELGETAPAASAAREALDLTPAESPLRARRRALLERAEAPLDPPGVRRD